MERIPAGLSRFGLCRFMTLHEHLADIFPNEFKVVQVFRLDQAIDHWPLVEGFSREKLVFQVIVIEYAIRQILDIVLEELEVGVHFAFKVVLGCLQQ